VVSTAQANYQAYKSARDLLLDLRTDYAAAWEKFAWPTLGETFSWAHDWFDLMATDNDRPALHIVEETGADNTYSFDDLRRRSNGLAIFLAAAGLGKGDRVAIMLGNQVELWVSMLAVMKLGAVVMPTTTALGPVDLADRVARGKVRAVIANSTDAAKFEQVPGDYLRLCVGERTEGWLSYGDAEPAAEPPARPELLQTDPLLLYFTSGTTSKPKMVEHTQVSYPVGHMSTMYWLGVQPGDVHLNISSPGWAKHAWSCFFAPWIAEACVFIYNYARFDAPALLEQLRTQHVSTFCAPPTAWRMLIQADLSDGPGALREGIAAGEPLNPEVIEQVRNAWGITLRDGFGQTETTAQVGNSPGNEVKAGSMGRPLPGTPVVLVDPATGRPADSGEICLDLSRHPVNLMRCYLDDAQREAEAMAGGYYHTGDLADQDAEGYITYVGRTDDVFKASDYKVSPFELESVLIEHPAVAEAAVVPAPDEMRLAVPKAYVTLAAGWTADEQTALAILKHCRENLAPYLRVRRVEFFELPKTISGKIRRVELRAREQDARAMSTAREWRDEQFPELRG
jgi:acetyl-CoA synthetase